MSRKKVDQGNFEEQFEAFLKDSLSSEDSINSAKINQYLDAASTKTSNKPWWDNDDNSNGGRKSFLKKKSPENAGPKRPDPNRMVQSTKDPPKPKMRLKRPDSSLSKDSLDDISEKSEEDHFVSRPRVYIPNESLTTTTDSIDEHLNIEDSPTRPGMDTMDELAEKERFFQDLENNADGTIDYGRLNQELSATGYTTMSPEGAAKTTATLAALQDMDDEEEDPPEVQRGMQPDHLLSEREQSEQKPSMLSKVSLMDSLESTMNTTTSPQVGKGTLRDAKDMLEERDEDDNDDEYDGPHLKPGYSIPETLKTNTDSKPYVLGTYWNHLFKMIPRSTHYIGLDEYDGLHLKPGYSIPETLKTNTGLVGTNTSQEIEALQKALEKVGLSTTIGNDSQLELSSHGDKETEELVKKLLNTDSGKQRNVAEVMKELEDLQLRVEKDGTGQTDGLHRGPSTSPRSLERQKRVDEMFGTNVNGLPEEMRGFALSPAQPAQPVQPYDPDYSQSNSHRADSQRDISSHRGGFEDSHTEETELYQPVTQVQRDKFGPSVTDRSRGKKKEKKKSNKTKLEGQETGSKSLRKTKDTIKSPRSKSPRSNSPLKIDFSDTMKSKFRNVKSSGYGKTSPQKPPREKSKDRDILGYSRSQSRTGTRQEFEHFGNRDTSPAKSRPKDVSPKRRETKIISDGTKQWSPADVSKQKVKGNQTAKQAKLGTVATSQLQASVESFAQYIKEHFSSKADVVPEVKYSQDEPFLSSSYKEKTNDLDQSKQIPADISEKEEIISKLRAELEAAEKSFERQIETLKLEYEQQIAELKQENFVLKAKVEGDDKIVKDKVLAGSKLASLTEDELSALQKELKEQETLISGYQQENKRLYDEMKNITKQSKVTEEKMFRENQKLLAEAANLRSQLEKKEDEIRNRGLITGVAAQQMLAAGNNDGVITTLENQLLESKRSADAVNREMMILQQSRVELEKHVEKLVIEREEMNKRLEESKTMKSEEARALELKYEGEIEKLKNKLKWYAENQEYLDKSAKQLKHKDDNIHNLKLRIEELQTESGKRVEDSKVRARERAADTKKIQDLQRQVKEMEQILKRRNPNSLPSLMIAAAAAPDNNQPNNRTAYTEVLEKRVSKLEAELDTKDAESDKLLRGVEQKYHTIKIQFEDRIKELELQLSIYQGQADHVHPHTHAVALERELESVRERYKQQLKDLNSEIDRLNLELTKAKRQEEASAKNDTQSKKESDSELRALVKSLQLEVENKNHDLQVMQKSLERLRKEKQTSFQPDFGKKQKLKGKGSKLDTLERNLEEPASLPNLHEKEYQPKVFEDTHISDVIKENEDMKTKIDRLQLQLDQQRVDYRKSLAENESLLRQTRDEYSEKLESVRTTHQQEVKKILAQQALQHSTSKMAELHSKVDTQEVMIKHLREQQARLEVEAETASVLRIKQTRLEETIKSLQNDLKEAKKSHSPEMRHFEALQDKIIQIENKHTSREQELQQIIMNHKQNASIELDKEVSGWKKLVETKNNEIQKFRMELDSILEVLRVLQKQGVIIPVS